MITYQDANGNYVSVNYLNALSNAPMKTALKNALSAAEQANRSIYVTTDSGKVINYLAAFQKNESYVTALTDSTVNNAIAPVPTEQMNLDGTVTQI